VISETCCFGQKVYGNGKCKDAAEKDSFCSGIIVAGRVILSVFGMDFAGS